MLPNVRAQRLRAGLLVGGVHVLDREARCLGVIRTPERVTNIAWGDDDLKSLYLTGITPEVPLEVAVILLAALMPLAVQRTFGRLVTLLAIASSLMYLAIAWLEAAVMRRR